MNARSTAAVFAALLVSACGIGAGGCGADKDGSSGQTAEPAAAPAAQTGAAATEAPPAGPPPAELATKLPADQIRASLPPLPVQPAPRPRDYVVAAYEFAALHPEVLKYVPCYCGCERSGHQHNESCFIASRAADGRVLAWDDHGMG